MSYDWIKPGAKYRVVAQDYGHQFDIGEIVTQIGEENLFTNGRNEWYLFREEVVPVSETHSNTLVAGGKYTGKNGHKWECVAVRGDTAWLAMQGDDGPSGSAYVFKTDGTNVSQGGSDWDIAFQPREEWVDTRFSVGVRNQDAPDGVDNHTARIRFKLVDGKPDWSTATVTE